MLLQAQLLSLVFVALRCETIVLYRRKQAKLNTDSLSGGSMAG